MQRAGKADAAAAAKANANANAKAKEQAKEQAKLRPTPTLRLLRLRPRPEGWRVTWRQLGHPELAVQLHCAITISAGREQAQRRSTALISSDEKGSEQVLTGDSSASRKGRVWRLRQKKRGH